MSNIRHVRPWEEDLIMPLCQQFHIDTGIRSTFSTDSVKSLLKNHKHAIIGAFDDGGNLVGILLGLLANQFLTTSVVAQEIVWYVHPDHRGATPHAVMLSLFEEWALANGADMIAVASLTGGPSSVPRFYAACGYSEIEKHYLKLI